MTVKSGYHVTPDQTRLVGRRARRLDSVKGHATLRRIERADAGIGTRSRGFREFDVYVLANRPDDGRESGSGDKENEQAQKHPGHSAHAAAAFPNPTARGCGHRSDWSCIRRKGTGRAVTGRGPWRSVLKTNCLCIFSGSFTQPKATVATEPQVSWHR